MPSNILAPAAIIESGADGGTGGEKKKRQRQKKIK